VSWLRYRWADALALVVALLFFLYVGWVVVTAVRTWH